MVRVINAVSLLAGIILAVGCNSNGGSQKPVAATEITAGIYSGDSTCHYEVYDGSTNQTDVSDNTFQDDTEINDNGLLVLNSTEVHVGQVTTVHLGGFDSRATVREVSTTADAIVVTLDIVFTIDDGTNPPLDLEGTGTFTIRSEGANRIRETASIFASYLDEFGILSLSQECDAVLTR